MNRSFRCWCELDGHSYLMARAKRASREHDIDTRLFRVTAQNAVKTGLGGLRAVIE